MKRNLSKGFARIGLGALVVATLAAACTGDDEAGQGSGPGAPSPSASRSLITIEVADNSYTPANLTIPKGSTVRWNWSGKNTHSLKGTWDGEPVESAAQRAGSFAFTFERAGTFEYQCGVHGAAMSAKVTVKD